jgi:hypothetical protein
MTKLLLFFVISCSQVKIAETPKVIPVKPSDVFVTKSTKKWILGAVDCANKVFHLDEAKLLILAATYEQTNDNSFEVLEKVKQTKLTQVKEYYPKNPFSKVVGVKFSNDPATYLNARKKRSISAATGTIFHEAIGHGNGFSHKGNQRRGNEKSVPYVLGDIGEKMAEKHCF